MTRQKGREDVDRLIEELAEALSVQSRAHDYDLERLHVLESLHLSDSPLPFLLREGR